MALSFKDMQPVLAHVAAHLADEISLTGLAAETGISPSHLHRVFSTVVGETPKKLTLRLRLGRAAVLLLSTEDSVLDIALTCGFQSHEAFCRAFRRRFRKTPSAYRRRGFVNNADTAGAREHALFVDKIGPCVGLYHIREEAMSKKNDMTYSITKKKLAPQPVLVIRRTVKRSEIASTIAEVLPRVFQYAQQHGLALVGQPFTRYVEVGPGLVTIEPGMCVAPGAALPKTSGEDGVVPDTLPGGLAATTMHAGLYEKLPDAYAAIEQWTKAEGLAARPGLWEVYVTDPADYPDPKDWKTEVFWPLG
jgi:AraC family transcriptional regulator